MTLRGDLQDMSLANLVQMLCLDQRQAMLKLKNQSRREGAIFFAGGQVVHAETGVLTGEEAIYTLLSWTDGTFEMDSQTMMPQQTVTAPWNHLLMEGMRLLDEQQAGAEEVALEEMVREPALSSADIDQDNSLESDLILLLSELEPIQTHLADKKIQKRPHLALSYLVTIVNEVVNFEETLPRDHPESISLSQTVVEIGETYPELKLLRIHNNRLSAELVSKIYNGWTGTATERHQTFNLMGQALLALIAHYLSQITTRFHATAVADQWQETGQIFLEELKRLVDKVQF